MTTATNTPVRITDAAPTGKGSIVSGCNVQLGLERFDDLPNIDIGTGTVSTIGPYAFVATGSYSFDLPGYSGSGSWSVDLSSTDSGSSWSCSAELTGTWSVSVGPAVVQASEAGSGDSTTITWSTESGGSQVVQSFQNDSFFEKAKLYLAFSLSGTSVQMYLYNTDVYSP